MKLCFNKQAHCCINKLGVQMIWGKWIDIKIIHDYKYIIF